MKKRKQQRKSREQLPELGRVRELGPTNPVFYPSSNQQQRAARRVRRL